MAALEKKKKKLKSPKFMVIPEQTLYQMHLLFFLLHLMGNTKKQLKQSEVELIWDERLKGEGEEDASS